MEIEDATIPYQKGFVDDPLRAALWEATQPHPVLFAAEAGAEEFAALAPLIYNRRSPMARHLQSRVESAVFNSLSRIGHPGGTPWVLTGGLGEVVAEGLTGQITAGLKPPAATPLDGALAMARAMT